MTCGCDKKVKKTSMDALRILYDKYLAKSAEVQFNLEISLQNRNTLPDHTDFMQSIETQIKQYTDYQNILNCLDNIMSVYLNEDDADNT